MLDDKLCSTIIVAAAVVLICIGYLELTRKNTSFSSSKCGMRSVVDNNSAKRAKISVNNELLQDKYENPGEFSELISDDQRVENKSLAQDNKAQMDFFQPLDDDGIKQMSGAFNVDKEQLKKSVGIKLTDFSVQIDSNSSGPGRLIGQSNPLLQMIAGCNGDKPAAKFERTCATWGGSDAYYMARKESKACDCLNEDCEKCK